MHKAIDNERIKMMTSHFYVLLRSLSGNSRELFNDSYFEPLLLLSCNLTALRNSFLDHPYTIAFQKPCIGTSIACLERERGESVRD